MGFKFLSVCTLVLVGLVCANLEGEGSLRGEELKGIIEGVINATLNTVIKKIPDPLIIPQFNMTFQNQTLASLLKHYQIRFLFQPSICHYLTSRYSVAT
ncbi:unnamed protein product [Callosobruchus maculatus]|uniref:Uncharacterized protein n=1 Tax=Callosobruchus maculatus TaxID=64391 RepID=A0A653D1X6_CALMS|nr:unnamed protein product [Callosobruchus maculatus]